jgi:hypothetical protein
MTYNTGGQIQAADYNAFASSISTIFGDLNSGATTLPNAGYGYGLTSVSSVTIGNTVTAAEWSTLFTTLRSTGTHQGTSSSPVPVSNPTAGSDIIAYNTPAMSAMIANLQTNRFVVAAGQTTLNTSGPYTSGSWTHTLAYTFSVNFGSWNNARYFFNSGGSIAITGYHPAGVGPGTDDDHEWNTMLSEMSPLLFKYNSTTPNTGAAGGIGGFWNPGTNNPLTTTYQTLYTKTFSTSPYSGSYATISAKLGATAGSAGSELLTFQVYLFQADSGAGFSAKTGTQFSISETHSAGAVVYPGSATITNLGFVAT